MHGIGAHSALAIKRQRRRRDPGKNRKRRGSQQANPDHYQTNNKVNEFMIYIFVIVMIFKIINI